MGRREAFQSRGWQINCRGENVCAPAFLSENDAFGSSLFLLGSLVMSIDRAALVAGGVRLASGISFLVDPLRANRLWGDPEEPTATARLLLRSMGYRDALIGGLLAAAALRGKDTRGWFLASGGADAADLLGGMSVHEELKPSQRAIGLGGAIVGIGVGVWGATRRRGREAGERS
jgi:hypothetical protein